MPSSTDATGPAPTAPTAPATATHAAPTIKGDRRSPANTGMRKYFEAAVRYEGSDLLLRGGLAPRLRLRGSLRALDAPPIDMATFEDWIEKSMSPTHWETFQAKGSADFGFDLDMPDGSVHRFRVNVFRTRGRSCIASRRVSNKILNFEQLHLPAVMKNIVTQHQGLILIAGVTGSGKSTTLAAMLQQINETRACHILTLEDPIEYLFTDAKAMFNQREIGLDCITFAEGLKALVRENPDVVLIGEMRDRETFEAALHASETGHLVFGTIHASSAAQAFGRIYDLFPADERESIRNMLAYQVQGFIYQKLIPTLREDIQRVPAVEVLLQSPPTRKFILEGREHELGEVIKGQKDAGMQTFNDSLASLVESGFVDPKVALANANNPEELKMRLKGIITR